MGDAMCFVSLLRVVALWFPPARSPMMTQLCGVFGQLGAIAAAGPLTIAVDVNETEAGSADNPAP